MTMIRTNTTMIMITTIHPVSNDSIITTAGLISSIPATPVTNTMIRFTRMHIITRDHPSTSTSEIPVIGITVTGADGTTGTITIPGTTGA